MDNFIQGAYAEYIALSSKMIIHKPASLSTVEAAGVPEVRAEERQVTLKWVRLPDRHEVSVALQVAGLRPETASNQVRIPVAPGRDPVEVALKALAALLLAPAAV